MKRIFLSLIAVTLLQILLYSAQERNQKLPTYIFNDQTIDGKNIDLSKYLGKKLILVNFWATWCPPCRYEIPDLINLQEEFKDSIIIVGVALDRNEEPVKIFSQKYKFNYPIVHDKKGINLLYGGISAIPTTIIINYEGKIVERIVGARSLDSFKSYIVKYLKK